MGQCPFFEDGVIDVARIVKHLPHASCPVPIAARVSVNVWHATRPVRWFAVERLVFLPTHRERLLRARVFPLSPGNDVEDSLGSLLRRTDRRRT